MITKLLRSAFTAAASLAFTAGLLHAAEPAEPEVLGVMFYADTCGSCKVLDPKIEAVKSSFLTKPVLFVKLDHSNDGTKNQSALLAGSLGLGEVYKAQEKASGFMLIVNADSKKVLGKLTRDMSEAEIKAELDKALAGG